MKRSDTKEVEVTMATYGRKETKATLSQNRIRIKKHYGQNFLVDKNMLEKIADTAALDERTGVVEIGPGTGNLTTQLVRRARHVLAYEIDEAFIGMLEETFSEERLTLKHGDVLKQDLDADIETHLGDAESIVLVANLPYYATTPIIMKCLEETTKIDRMVVLVQYEVARRLSAVPKTKDYNALSVAIRYRSEHRFAFKVPRHLFMPAPAVESAVIVLKTKREQRLERSLESYFFRLVKASFRHRRKTLLNNLSVFSEHAKDTLEEKMKQAGIHPGVRAETLDLEAFIRLARIMHAP